MKMNKKLWLLALIVLFVCCLSACSPNASGTADSGDPDYEAQTIIVKGLPDGDKEISIAELRELEQHDLDASYKRTTGMTEKFFMQGPYLADVIAYLGGNLADYPGIGVMGRDGYYCMVDAATIAATPDLMLAVTIDHQPRLEEGTEPARLAVQGTFGPFWVKMVSTITLYQEIPAKEIKNVWLFDNLIEGIDSKELDYYGSMDKCYPLDQIFTRFDNVLSTAFFTMKSSDGFQKNEAISMLLSDYYIKVDGVDAPTNISPNIMLGMNVQKIAWFSTNADAAIFPSELASYMATKKTGNYVGLPLADIILEAGVTQIEEQNFELFGMNGERITVAGTELYDALLVSDGENHTVIWPDDSDKKPIIDLLKLSLVEDATSAETVQNGKDTEPDKQTNDPADNSEPVVLTISGSGVIRETNWTLSQLKLLTDGYRSAKYSTTNNWPTYGYISAQGISLPYLLRKAGMTDNVACVILIASDGYKATVTYDQVFGTRYSYSSHSATGSSGASAVEPVIAWAWGEDGTVRDEKLRPIFGQIGPMEVNTAVAVKNLSRIEVSTSYPGSWKAPTASVVPGNVLAGTEVELLHDNLDSLRIYYTLDGTTPTYNSAVYNPSTSYFQPDLIVPLVINDSVTIKAFASGFGKADSPIATFTYTVE